MASRALPLATGRNAWPEHPIEGQAEPPGGIAASPLPALLLTWAIGLALVGGTVYLTPTTSPWLLALVAIAVPIICLLWSRPELGLLGISLITAALVPRTLVTFSLAGFDLYVADILLIAMLTLLFLRGLHRRTLEIPRWSMTGPLLAFTAFAVFSALYARYHHGVSVGLIVGELRPAAYAGGCALVAGMLARRQQHTILLVGLFVIADMTTGLMMLQQFLGATLGPVTTFQELWQVGEAGTSGEGLGSVRVVPPAHVLMYLMTNIACCLLLGPLRSSWLRFALALQLVFLGTGLLLTYTRAQWIASVIALLLACALLPPAARKRLGRFLILAVPILGLCVGLVGNGVLPLGETGFGQALAERATSVLTPGETLGTASLGWRSFEVEAAIRSLSEHPILGVGLGNDYRELTLLQGEASGWLYDLSGPSRLTRFVHSSYVYLAVKVGLVTMVVFFWFCLAFLVEGSRVYSESPEDSPKYIVLASVCSFAGLLEWGVFEAHFMLPASMATLGLMVGIVAAGSRYPAPEDPGGEPRRARLAQVSR